VHHTWPLSSLSISISCTYPNTICHQGRLLRTLGHTCNSRTEAAARAGLLARCRSTARTTSGCAPLSVSKTSRRRSTKSSTCGVATGIYTAACVHLATAAAMPALSQHRQTAGIEAACVPAAARLLVPALVAGQLPLRWLQVSPAGSGWSSRSAVRSRQAISAKGPVNADNAMTLQSGQMVHLQQPIC
jgi:hypothetical protein